MVRFDKKDTFGFEIIVNDRKIGYMSEIGFSFTDRGTDRPFKIDPSDLRDIALKFEEFLEWGMKPPICSVCSGTPSYPQGQPDGRLCPSQLHQARMKLAEVSRYI